MFFGGPEVFSTPMMGCAKYYIIYIYIYIYIYIHIYIYLYMCIYIYILLLLYIITYYSMIVAGPVFTQVEYLKFYIIV